MLAPILASRARGWGQFIKQDLRKKVNLEEFAALEKHLNITTLAYRWRVPAISGRHNPFLVVPGHGLLVIRLTGYLTLD